MNLRLSGKQMRFRRERRHSNPYRVFLLLTLLIGGLFLLRSVSAGTVRPLFMPTPTATRISTNYALEGQTHFEAGNLSKAIEAYQEALKQDPNNPQLWAELARIQTYTSNLLSTDQQKYDRLKEALASADKAVELAPEDSTAHAIRAFVLDWNSSSNLQVQLDQKTATKELNEAEQEAQRAVTLDKGNALAHAYYAEIMTDQMRWDQADAAIKTALQLNPNSMDVHRVYAYLLESVGDYANSIEEYKKAAEISKNLTFLYNSIAMTYRHLRQYDQALSFYSRAVEINTNLGIKDPLPYIGISKTYVQMGEFFAAALNVRKALSFNPDEPDVYAQLGIVYWHSRNYEGSIPALRCALYGCDAKTSCEVRKCDPATDPQVELKGMPLTGSTVVYYYTYGSVLAAMHQKGDDLCDQAMQVLEQVRGKYSSDDSIMSIVETSEDICRSYGVSSPSTVTTPEAAGTGQPQSSSTPVETATPAALPTLTETPLPTVTPVP